MFFGCWLGGDLPSAFGTSPYIQLDKTELVFTADPTSSPQTQTITVSNIGKGTMGKVSASIEPSTEAWLQAAVLGSGGNTQAISVTVDPSKLPQDNNTATITVSGGSAPNTVSCKVIANTGAALPAPTQLIAEPAGDSLLDVALSWKDNSADETGFTIERRSATGAWKAIGTAGKDAVSYTDERVGYGDWYYRVKATTDGAESAASDSVKVAIVGTYWIRIVSPPQSAVYKPGMVVPVVWECNRVSQVYIQYSLDEGLSWTTVTKEGGIGKGDAAWRNYAWTVPDTEAEKALVKVAEYDHHAEAVSGAFAISKTKAALSDNIYARQMSDCISVFSVDGQLCINAGDAQQATVQIYSAFGKLVFKRSSVGHRHDFISPPLPSGIYTVIVKSGAVGTMKRVAVYR
jgi:hypothetical protein